MRETFDVVSHDEKQNENRENLLVIPCLLKPSSGLLVLSDDGEQTPPFLTGVLKRSKSKPGLPEPVQTMNLQDLHMSTATSPYRPLMQKPVPIQTWLIALFNLLKKRQRLVEELTLPNFKACESDEDDVTIVTLPNLDGLLSQAEATCMKRCELPGLLFSTCCRLPPTMALLTGIQYYPSAFGSIPRLLRQGPLPSIPACLEREKRLRRPPAWFFSLPPGRRDENGDLPNTAAADLALALAFALGIKMEKELNVDCVQVGIVVSHNKTLSCMQEKYHVIWKRITTQDIVDLGVALIGREAEDEKLQDTLQFGGYRITLVPGQSAISTDFDCVIVSNCYDNKFVRALSRHNVWNTRCRILNIFLCPESQPLHRRRMAIGIFYVMSCENYNGSKMSQTK